MKPKKLLLIVVALVAATAWGAFAERRGIFPVPQISSAWASVRGLFETSETTPPGSWSEVRERVLPENLDPEKLRNLPYLGHGDKLGAGAGVTAFDPDTAGKGINLVVSGHGPEASLMDMSGNVIHTWRKKIEDLWPGPLGFEEFEPHKTFWRRAHVFPNGDLLAIFEGIGMVKLDIDSNVIWKNKCRSHHDLFVADDGVIHTLARYWRDQHDTLDIDDRYLEDYILVLSPGGEELSRVSILQALLDSDYASLLSLARKSRDLLHTNTIEVLDGRHAAKYPMWQQGHVLLSVPSLNAVMVVDPTAKVVTWAVTGLWGFQHQPTVLEDGRLLVFDNLGNKHNNANGDGISRIVEIDPLTREIVWRYTGSELVPFESEILGSSQRLSNGNTLITEGMGGRALEVMPDGMIVWEYLNPHKGGDRDQYIASLMEVVRLDIAPFLQAFPQLGGAETTIDIKGVRELIDRGKGGDKKD